MIWRHRTATLPPAGQAFENLWIHKASQPGQMVDLALFSFSPESELHVALAEGIRRYKQRRSSTEKGKGAA